MFERRLEAFKSTIYKEAGESSIGIEEADGAVLVALS